MRSRISALISALAMVLGLLPASVQAAKLPTVEDIPSPGTAYAAEQTVVIDGQAVTFQMYALKDASGYGTNYIRLRDLAYALNGTAAQFEVEYDGSIRVVPGQPYTPAGGEMTTPFTGDRIYTGGPLVLRVDGDQVPMTAITLLDANGGGYTYFKLRDLGAVLDFYVGWDDTAKKVTLDTGSESEGSSAQSMSDQELTELARELMGSGVGLAIANADFVEIDSSDVITVDDPYGGMTYCRVIGLQTIAQAEKAANDYWYSVYSRRSTVDSDLLDMMRHQLLERDGGLYKADGFGVGDSGEGPVLDRLVLVSRSATEAVFDAHYSWSGEGADYSDQFSLVLEDGAWRYLDRETAGSGAPSVQDGPDTIARAMLEVMDSSCTDACLVDVDGDGVQELLVLDRQDAKLYTWQDGQLTSKRVGSLAGGYQSWDLCQDKVTGERGIRYSNSGASYVDTVYHYPSRDISLRYVHSDDDSYDFHYYYIDGREVARTEYTSVTERNQSLETLIDGTRAYAMPEIRIKAVRSELNDLLAGRTGRDLSDQTLIAQAEIAANNMDTLFFDFATGYFIRCDWDDPIALTVGELLGDGEGGDIIHAYRAIDYQTIAQARAGVQEEWYRLFSRRYPIGSDECPVSFSSLEMMLIERNGALYRVENFGMGDRGGFAVIDRIVSRTADEIRFQGYWSYGDDSGDPLEISLVYEDGIWKYGLFLE